MNGRVVRAQAAGQTVRAAIEPKPFRLRAWLGRAARGRGRHGARAMTEGGPARPARRGQGLAGLGRHGVRTVGPIPAGLPVPLLPEVDPRVLRELLLPAFTVLVVGFSDDVLTARSFARRGETITANQELLALGVANVGSSLLRGFPVSSSATRTAIAVTTGSRTSCTR
jgi:hypothetical protein